MKSETIYPSFSGISTFIRADIKSRDDIKEGEYAVIGAPFDTTLGTRPGARYAPKSIREESAHYIYHFSAIDKEVIDVCSGVRYKYEEQDMLFDTGDARVYPGDIKKTTDSIADEVDKVVSKGAIPVILGGDHYITYPCMVGFEKGMEKHLNRKPKIGYIHIDSHLDAYNENDTWVLVLSEGKIKHRVLNTAFNSDIKTVGKLMYPVGSIYLSVKNTNPSSFFGGTWVAWGTGRVPVGVNASDNDFKTVEKTGGEKTHKLTIEEVPPHSHRTWIKDENYSSLGDGYGNYFYGKGHYYNLTTQTGGGGAHNNLQPYITCYMWKRTS